MEGWFRRLGIASAAVLAALPAAALAQTAQVSGIPFAATQVITRTSSAGTVRTEGRIARNTAGSSYVEIIDPQTGVPVRGLIVDVPGKRLIHLDLVHHRYVIREEPALQAETVPNGSALDMLRWAEAHRSAVVQETHGDILSTQTWLGTRQVGGLLTVGTLREQREETTPPGKAQLESSAAAVQTDESWFSIDLKMSVLMTEHRLSTGETIEVLLTRILRSEPDAALFAIPEGFSQEKQTPAPPVRSPASSGSPVDS